MEMWRPRNFLGLRYIEKDTYTPIKNVRWLAYLQKCYICHIRLAFIPDNTCCWTLKAHSSLRTHTHCTWAYTHSSLSIHTFIPENTHIHPWAHTHSSLRAHPHSSLSTRTHCPKWNTESTWTLRKVNWTFRMQTWGCYLIHSITYFTGHTAVMGWIYARSV